MATASNEMTEHAEKESGTYKPTEHGGLKEDGTPDKRVSSEHGESRRRHCPQTNSPLFSKVAVQRRRSRTVLIHSCGTVRLGFGGDKELASEAGTKGGKVGQEQMAYE
jgi:hypothetical protein